MASIQKIILFLLLPILTLVISGCSSTYQDVQLRQIRNVTADVSTSPLLKAEAVFHNPNSQKGKLKAIHMDVYLNDKKAARIDQKFRIKVPAKGEFIIPLEATLNMKEQGLFNTLLGAFGAKKFNVRYKGYITVTYHGLPARVAVEGEEVVRIRL